MKINFDEAYEAVKDIQSRENAPMSDHIIKLQEEVGEIAESYLLMSGYKNPKLSIDEERLHLTEEAVDAIIVSMAILNSNNASKNYVEHLLKIKIEKWNVEFEKKKNSKLESQKIKTKNENY